MEQYNNATKLLQTLHTNDPKTYRHSVRVASLMYCMRKNIPHLPDNIIIWAGLLHDIGKLHTPPNILNAARSLTPEERQIIQQHATDGYNILTTCQPTLPTSIIQAAQSHHEQWNGEGYPNKLKGNTIPPIARLCQVCDIFEAITSKDRDYRAPDSINNAKKLLQRFSGSIIDPSVVNAFLAIPETTLKRIIVNNDIPGPVSHQTHQALQPPQSHQAR